MVAKVVNQLEVVAEAVAREEDQRVVEEEVVVAEVELEEDLWMLRD